MASLLEQRKELQEKFNAQALAMKSFVEEKNPLGLGGETPASDVIEQFDAMHQDQVKTRDLLDRVDELLNLTNERKSIGENEESSADIEARLRAEQAFKATQGAGGSRYSDNERYAVKTKDPMGRGEKGFLNPDQIAENFGQFVKSRELKVSDFEKNGSTNIRAVFTWGDGQKSFDKDPQRFAGGVIDRKSLYTYSVNNAYVNGGPGALGFACNLDIDPDICLIENPAFCLTDCVSTRRTTGGRIWYTRQMLRQSNATGVQENITCDTGVQKPESNYGFGTFEVPVITLAHILCASDEALDDCENMVELVRTQLREDLARLERQYIITGTGVGGANPQYRGILNTPGIISHVFRGAPRGQATDTIQDSIRRAKTDIMLAGKTPDCVLINVNDAEKMDLAKTTFETILYPNLNCTTPQAWCMNICADADVPQGTAIVGGFRQSATLYRRQEIVLEMGYINAQFVLDQVVIRAKMRGAFALKCPQGIVRINNIV